jgi:hypothetical protein
MEEGEVAFYVPSTCTLIVAEFLLGEDGALRVLPSPAVEDCEAFRRSLRGLLGMRIDRVLVAHGDPILNHGHARIRDALQAFSAGLAD